MTTTNYPTCTHILTKGTYCQSPALTDGDLCYYHSREYQRKTNLNQARELKNSDHFYKYPLQQEALNPDIIESLDIPALDDAESVQVALTNVIRALVSGHISDKKAGLALFGLQIAAGNARRVHLKIYSHEDAATDDPQPLAALVNVPIYPAGYSDELKAQAAAKRAAARDASTQETENENSVAPPSDEFASPDNKPPQVSTLETRNEKLETGSETRHSEQREEPASAVDLSFETRNAQLETAVDSVPPAGAPSNPPGFGGLGGNETLVATTPDSDSEQSEEPASPDKKPPQASTLETRNEKLETRSQPLAPNARERLARAAVRLAGKPNSKTFAQHIKLAAALHQGKLNAAEFLKEQKQEQTNGTSSQ